LGRGEGWDFQAAKTSGTSTVENEWLDRLGPVDAQDVRHAIPQMILTDAGHSHSLGIW
jgi:hypothetical protein